ncbi:uncharacterized protein BDR25DRAFT_318555 [Lindgomyces ingoldianus]|uniref:Uncharacterized protein n=1 Tax=Lindgomyces ingoldianus TaxID=673940 RepID=A0ACB6QEC5_9PLEO|nr:uncharacterized protein BDR25DRAFT_318555 [Lindgomyces ingoldianus]KAF2465303.1 hypothetical protein BDR25DRAFT_318555 [Lindgomyces ingoldianus]
MAESLPSIREYIGYDPAVQSYTRPKVFVESPEGIPAINEHLAGLNANDAQSLHRTFNRVQVWGEGVEIAFAQPVQVSSESVTAPSLQAPIDFALDESTPSFRGRSRQGRIYDPSIPRLPTPDIETGVYGNSYDDAVGILASYWKPPPGDAGIPRTNEEKRKIVRRLRDAVLNKINTGDNKGRGYAARWGLESEQFYQNAWVDRICWEVLNETIKLHEEGFTVPIFDKDLDAHVDKKLDFSERIDALVKLFHDWKSVCDSLMKMEKIVHYVAGPIKYYQRSGSNKKNNAHKKRTLETWKADAQGRNFSTIPTPTREKGNGKTLNALAHGRELNALARQPHMSALGAGFKHGQHRELPNPRQYCAKVWPSG